MRSITCINSETEKSITIEENSFAPLFLAGLEGVYLTDNEVAISENTMSDGGTYQGSRANTRNIVITAIDQPNNVYNQSTRDLIYTVFRKGERGTFIYREDDVEPRKIDYYVEKVEREDGGKRIFTISLICPDPAFSDLYETQEYMANWKGMFEFIHEWIEEGEELGVRMLERLVTIINDSAAKEIGITAVIEVMGTVKNPSLSRVESNEIIQIGSASNPFYLYAGDELVITTHKNNKHVKVKRDGSDEYVEVNEYLTEDSEFFSLLWGINTIAYDADENPEYMVVTLYYSFKYDGA